MKKTLFVLLTSLVLIYSGCKSDIEPQASFKVSKQSGEGVVSVANTSNMYESATIVWGDGTQEPISNKELYHTYQFNSIYTIQLKATNGKKTTNAFNQVEINDVPGRIGIYTSLPIGPNTPIGSSGLYCRITGNGITKFFYITKGTGADLNSCSQLSDDNIWKLPVGDYLINCENMAKTYQWTFNARVESGKCQVRELTK